ncbi:MAG: hypothetical protein MR953_00140 [Butyrivibrio crossotus]|nr:hypothetical protein [Butyrivibrio crossotus]
MQRNYYECERLIVDFCLQKLDKCIEREYYEVGSYKPTNADRLLDRKLNQMMKEKSAWKYAYIKQSIESMLQAGNKLKCLNIHNDDIILRLFGMSDEEDTTIEQYVKFINQK